MGNGVHIKRIIVGLLSIVGIRLLKTSTFKRLSETELDYVKLLKVIDFKNVYDFSDFEEATLKRAADLIPKSMAQLQQDIVCLMILNFKENGFFVEFGATDGVKLSNSFLLENDFKWKGILAEPGRNWHEKLKSNRKSIIETRCVYTHTGEFLAFNETNIGELSTIHKYSFKDKHSNARKDGNVYDVETVSLNDLLAQNNAPTHIDYLSIDTEGSEYEILLGVDFEKYTFGFITCEHNFTSNRALIYDLLTSKGYQRVFVENSLYDDWYVHQSIL